MTLISSLTGLGNMGTPSSISKGLIGGSNGSMGSQSSNQLSCYGCGTGVSVQVDVNVNLGCVVGAAASTVGGVLIGVGSLLGGGRCGC